jgi:hypothetical protein
MELETRGAILLVAHVSLLLGKEESGSASQAENALLRLLTPIVKLYTAKQGWQFVFTGKVWLNRKKKKKKKKKKKNPTGMFVASEGIEALGGVGYCEPSGMPRYVSFKILRQSSSNWESTFIVS